MFTTARPTEGPDARFTSIQTSLRGSSVRRLRIFTQSTRHRVQVPVSRRTLLAGAAGIVGAGILAACGDDDTAPADSAAAAANTAAPSDTAAPTGDTAAPAGDTAAPAGDTAAPAASGDAVTVGVYETTGKPYQSFVASLDTTGVPYKGNFVDHNSFQDNITAYLQQPDDVFTWFSGYRMRFFADKGLAGDISDVWANLPDFSESFKAASTGNDGKQYLVPTSYYPWAVHYRKSLFEGRGDTHPDQQG